MRNAVLRIIIFFASSAIGLLFAGLVVNGISLRPGGFILGVVVFAIAQSLLTPLARKIAQKNAPKLLGLIGLASTFVALAVAALLPGGIIIRGPIGWLGGALVVWLVTALATWALPMFLLKDGTDTKATDDGPLPGVVTPPADAPAQAAPDPAAAVPAPAAPAPAAAVPTAPAPAAPAPVPPAPSAGQETTESKLIEQLRELGDLRQRGIISNEDFEAAKAPIIARMAGN